MIAAARSIRSGGFSCYQALASGRSPSYPRIGLNVLRAGRRHIPSTTGIVRAMITTITHSAGAAVNT
jgi:hypothetical protein